MARDPLSDERPEPNLEYLGIPRKRVRDVEEILVPRPDGLIQRNVKANDTASKHKIKLEARDDDTDEA